MPLPLMTAMSVGVFLEMRYVLRQEGAFLLVRVTRICLRPTTTLCARRAPALLSLTTVPVLVTIAAAAVGRLITRPRSLPAFSSPGSLPVLMLL